MLPWKMLMFGRQPLTNFLYRFELCKVISVCILNIYNSTTIGRFNLKIPFKNLYTEPVVAELDGLYILAVPRAGLTW